MKKICNSAICLLILIITHPIQSRKLNGINENRKVSPIRSILKPTYSGGVDGDPKEEIPVPTMPVNWDGISIQYYKDENESNPMPINTYLVWNTKTKEGIIINPLKREIPFIIEAAKNQKGIHWLYVIDTHTYFKDETTINDFKAYNEGNPAGKFKPEEKLIFQDFDNLLKEKNETISVEEIASKLNSTALIHGFKKAKLTNSGSLTVCRRGIPHFLGSVLIHGRNL